MGLMLGVELVRDRGTKEPAKQETLDVLEAAREMGVLVGKGGLDGNVLRIKPPMCITAADAEFALDVLDRALGKAASDAKTAHQLSERRIRLSIRHESSKAATSSRPPELSSATSGSRARRSPRSASISTPTRRRKVIDANGHHVIPGVLDVHVHLELPFCGTVSADDYRTGTRAGARGGVTTRDRLRDSVRRRLARAKPPTTG